MGLEKGGRGAMRRGRADGVRREFSEQHFSAGHYDAY